MRRQVHLADASGEFKVGKMPFGALCQMMDAVAASGIDVGSVFSGKAELGEVVKALLLRAPEILAIALTGGPDGASATGLSRERLDELSINDTLTLLEAFLEENPVDELLGKAKNLVGLAARGLPARPGQSESGPGEDTSSTL